MPLIADFHGYGRASIQGYGIRLRVHHWKTESRL
jgi:hypothetical protein